MIGFEKFEHVSTKTQTIKIKLYLSEFCLCTRSHTRNPPKQRDSPDIVWTSYKKTVGFDPAPPCCEERVLTSAPQCNPQYHQPTKNNQYMKHLVSSFAHFLQNSASVISLSVAHQSPAHTVEVFTLTTCKILPRYWQELFSLSSACFGPQWSDFGLLFFLLFLVFGFTFFNVFLYLSSHQLHKPPFSPERKECIIKQESGGKAVTPLWHLGLIATFTISLKLVWRLKTELTWRKRNWNRNCQNSWCPHFSSKTAWRIHFFTVCVMTLLHDIISLVLFQQLQHATESANAKQRFILGQIPAKGARASWVHHYRTHGSCARLCRETLCYLAYFSIISDGPAPNRSSNWVLMVDGARGRVERISQRENGQRCQGRGPPRPEWHTLNRWQGFECWPTGIHQRDGWSHTGRENRTVLPCYHSSEIFKQTYNMVRKTVLSGSMRIARQSQHGLGFVFWKSNN